MDQASGSVVAKSMTMEDKKVEDKTIDCVMDDFASNLDPDGILTKCLKEDLVTAETVQSVMAKVKNGEGRSAIMDLLFAIKKSAPGYLQKFCKILRESPKTKFLADIVENGQWLYTYV